MTGNRIVPLIWVFGVMSIGCDGGLDTTDVRTETAQDVLGDSFLKDINDSSVGTCGGDDFQPRGTDSGIWVSLPGGYGPDYSESVSLVSIDRTPESGNIEKQWLSFQGEPYNTVSIILHSFEVVAETGSVFDVEIHGNALVGNPYSMLLTREGELYYLLTAGYANRTEGVNVEFNSAEPQVRIREVCVLQETQETLPECLTCTCTGIEPILLEVTVGSETRFVTEGESIEAGDFMVVANRAVYTNPEGCTSARTENWAVSVIRKSWLQ